MHNAFSGFGTADCYIHAFAACVLWVLKQVTVTYIYLKEEASSGFEMVTVTYLYMKKASSGF